jgi:hypothetical protein
MKILKQKYTAEFRERVVTRVKDGMMAGVVAQEADRTNAMSLG